MWNLAGGLLILYIVSLLHILKLIVVMFQYIKNTLVKAIHIIKIIKRIYCTVGIGRCIYIIYIRDKVYIRTGGDISAVEQVFWLLVTTNPPTSLKGQCNGKRQELKLYALNTSTFYSILLICSLDFNKINLISCQYLHIFW